MGHPRAVPAFAGMTGDPDKAELDSRLRENDGLFLTSGVEY
jgi:hypothetical protein